jgi:hypothetical protein
MAMSEEIKTRAQLLDQQADAADFATTPGDDRRNESTLPHQADDGTVTHMRQEGAAAQGSVDAVRRELEQLRERMAVIKQEATVEVDRKWVSPWRTQEVFDLKVRTRLTSHQEYRSLQDRVRDAKASLPTESDVATEPGTAD